MDIEEYNFEDFDYEPEELPAVNEKSEVKEVSQEKAKVIENKSTYEKQQGTSRVGKTTQEDYGGFEECNDDDVKEVDEVKYDDLFSNRKVSERAKEISGVVKDVPPSINYEEEPKKSEKVQANVSKHRDEDLGLDKINFDRENENPELSRHDESVIQNEIKRGSGEIYNDIDKFIQPQSQKSNINIESDINLNREDINSVSAIVHQQNNSRFATNLHEQSQVKYPKLSGVIGNRNNIVSRMQMAENDYLDLKGEIQNLINEDINLDDEEMNKAKTIDTISKQNLDLIQYLDKMNNIINVVVESSRVPVKNPNFSKKSVHAINRVNGESQPNTTFNGNSKLLDVYKKEYSKLDSRLKQIAEPTYEEKLDENLNELNSLITYYEQENKKLKSTQKQSEVKFERQYKNNIISNAELKKINMDYDNIKKLNELVLEKVQKNKVQISDNESRLEELNEWHTKLETIARDMYKIKDFDLLKEEENTEKKAQEKKQILRKKMEVLEKVMATNKKKYEFEISRNEKTIINLERNKIELMKLLKEKSITAYRSQEKVKGIYHQYDDNAIMTPDIFVDNSNHFSNNLGNLGNSDNNSNKNLATESNNVKTPKEKIKVAEGNINFNNNLNANGNEKTQMNASNINNTSIMNNNVNNNSAIEENSVSKKNTSELTKKDILKELEKKSVEDNNNTDNNTSNLILNLNSSSINTPNTQINTLNNLNNANSNTISQQPGTKFKPNFKFGNISNNKNIINTTSQMNIIDNNENINYNAGNKNSTSAVVNKNNPNEIQEEITPVVEEESKETNTANVNLKVQSLLSQNEIPEIKDEETIFNSRRKQNSNSIIEKRNISIVEKETEIKELNEVNEAKEVNDKGNPLLNNRSISSYREDKKTQNVPLFLQGFHNKSENQNNNSILNNSVTQNNKSSIISTTNRRPKESNDTKKPVSIFDDAFKEEKENEQININNIQNRRTILLSDSDGFNEEQVPEVDKKKKDDFDNLFKDDVVVEAKKQEDIPTSNLLFSNVPRSHTNIETRVRNQGTTNIFNNTKPNETAGNANKNKNILDELDEIVL